MPPNNPYNPYGPTPGGQPQPQPPQGQGGAGYGQPSYGADPYGQSAQPGGYGVAPNPYGGTPANPYSDPYAPQPQPQPFQQQAAPQPQQPAVPYFLDPNGPYGPLRPPVTQQRKPSSRTKGLLTIIIIAAVLFIGGIVAIIAMSGGGNSNIDSTFQAAIEHSFATTSYTQKVTLGQNTETMDVDTSDPKAAKANADVNLKDSDVAFTGYGDMQNTLVKFTNSKGVDLDSSVEQKWVQARKDGKQPTADKTLRVVSPVIDPQILLLGDFPRGNFGATDRQALVSLIQQQGVYTYDSGNVATGVIGGQAVYVYNVKMSADGLKQLNAKYAELSGIDSDTVNQNSSIGKITAATVYVSIDTQQIIKTEEKSGSDTISTEYSDINNTKLNSSPVAELQWSDLATFGAAGSDTARKLQLGSIAVQLEAYFAKNKHYPTLDNLNDPNWLQANFSGFDANKLKDPAGSGTTMAAAPAKNQFAYQVGTDKNLGDCKADASTCKYYKLSATLDDGSVYVKESL